MCSTYNFYELCGKSGAPNKKILEELQGLGIEITRSELRERLARAVALGYMIRKTRGHVFLSKICDRHVLSLLGTTSQNNEEIFDEKLMDDIDNDESAGNNRNAMTMTEVIKGTTDRVDSISDIEQNKDGKNDKESVRDDNSESENCFLKECWQQVGSFIEGLDKKSVRNRNCDGTYYSQSRVQQPTTLKPSTSKISEIPSKAGSSRKSETNTHGGVGNVENIKENTLESGSIIEEKEIKISASSSLISNKIPNKRTDQQQQDEGQKSTAAKCAKECSEDKNSKLSVKETPTDSDTEND